MYCDGNSPYLASSQPVTAVQVTTTAAPPPPPATTVDPPPTQVVTISGGPATAILNVGGTNTEGTGSGMTVYNGGQKKLMVGVLTTLAFSLGAIVLLV